MDNGVITKHNFFDRELIDKIKAVYLNDQSLLEKKKSFENINSYYIGYTINSPLFVYTDKVESDYNFFVKKYNKILLDNFEFLYEPLQKKLSEVYGIECKYDSDRLLLPGIRLFKALKDCTQNYDNHKGYHYDRVLRDFVVWPKLFKNTIVNTISVTICLEKPEYTTFEWIDGTQTNDPKIYRNDQYNTINTSLRFLPEEVFARNKVFEYQIGSAALQWNQTLHRHGATIYKAGQRRSTIQVSGIVHGDILWLTW